MSKANVWQSNNQWNLTTNDDGTLINIKNADTEKVLGIDDFKVIEEDFVQCKLSQLWKKGQPNNEGYFTLQNAESSKVMTAISRSSLEIKGKWFNVFSK